MWIALFTFALGAAACATIAAILVQSESGRALRRRPVAR
jgi:hypothetical protein